MRTGWIALPLAAAMASGLGACAGLQFHLDCTEEPGICDAPDGGGLDAEGGPDANVVIPSGCDLTKSPKESPECVADGVGIFVSASGKDGATGTKADPLKSIAEAVTRGKPRVYVCDGSYDVPVVIAQPIAIFGGLTCAWAPSATKPKVAPPKGIGIKVTKVLGSVLIEDIDVLANADANVPGDSAIAALVSEANNVTLRRVSLTAGAGTAGTKGGSKTNYTPGLAKNGANANASNGGPETPCSCADGITSSKGGRGGTVGVGALDPSSGAATPVVGGVNEGNNGGAGCVPGTLGTPGLATTGGTPSDAPGALTALGWNASKRGGAGGSGNPGQGGGGGGGITMSAQGGAGGACGGCGGAGGDAGPNGGSSFALLSFQSTITIDGGALASGAGGKGGDGGNGEAGQRGGSTGLGACVGGGGGNGAGGSGGGGGSGGHSGPIGFVGIEPKVTGATVTPSTGGPIGAGGTAGAGLGTPGNGGMPGPVGKAQNTLLL